MMKLLRWFGVTVMWAVVAVTLGIFIAEWMVGCGETYVDARGVRHVNECVFIPQ